MEEYQCTIKNKVSIEGVGLHTGRMTHLTFKNAPEDTGIVFVRVDLPGTPRIPAKVDYANHRERSTSLEKDGIKVNIIEHVMAAAAGIGIDNLIIEIDNSEPPVLDGSAKSYAEVLRKAGKKSQNRKKEIFTPLSPYIVSNNENDSYLMLIPSDSKNVTYTFEFPNRRQLENSVCSICFNDEENFAKDVAPARTFGFLEEVQALKEKGLIKGGSLDNAVVIDGDKVLNEDLRFPNEIARHKALDVIGDLFLSGKHLRKTHIIGVKSGHSLNIQMAKKITKAPNQSNVTSDGSGLGGGEMGEGMDIKEIKKILPHRHPFLFVDRILSLGKRRAVGLKSVSSGENFFQGHFPEFPIMPAVIIVEAMAQVAGVLLLSKSSSKGKLPFFGAIDNAKFRKPVLPGDQLLIEVEIQKLKKRTGKVHSTATVGDKKVAEADFIFSLVDKQ
jgi:UDP-3-O-[3-hydroxymyristoyl] N-acetylglucosamine deacetylase/3-hydroxyacyl-[acyl-carrier-protein] dehydratase